MFEEVKGKIETFIAPLLDELKVEVVELGVYRRNRIIAVQLTVEKLQGRINIDECAAINRAIAEKLEETDWIADEYVVEVASPGLDRLLKTKRDFERVLNQRVHCFLSEPVGGRLEYMGILQNVREAAIQLSIKTGEVVIPLEKINKAVQVI